MAEQLGPHVQYGPTDYVCGAYHNGSTYSNGTRFRIADIEREVLAALELDFLSPAALQRATDLAMEYFEKQQRTEADAAPPVSATLAEIDKRETEVREQFKAGKLPQPVLKSWITESAKEREALDRPAAPKVPRVSRSEFLQTYRSAAERKPKSSRARETLPSHANRCEPR